jgi:hypothetical protein
MLDTAVPLYFLDCESARQWEAAKRKLRRQKSSYAAVRTVDGKVTVISTIAIVHSPDLPPFGAAEYLAQAMLNLSSQRKPIATSRDWQRYLAEQKANLYRRVGAAPEGAFAKTVRQLQADKIVPTLSETPRGEKCIFELPEAWPDERTTPYLAGLGWGIDPKGGGDDSDLTDAEE